MLRRRALALVGSFTSPLAPDDYLEMINPLWSTRELRGRVESVQRECENAVTVTIRPGWEWPGHLPGQYLRLGLEVDGVHHWRAYSLTSDPDRRDGCITVTPKLVPGGRVSPYIFSRLRAGAIVRLGGVEGGFLLPEPLPARLLFLSAGSGITPIMSMLRSLRRRGRLLDIVHLHSARTPAEVIFAAELRELAAAHPGYRLSLRATASEGRLAATELQRLCPDWQERESFLCGPPQMLDELGGLWRERGAQKRMHLERFVPEVGLGEELAPQERGAGGAIAFVRSDCEARSDGLRPILAAGEDAGLTLPHGCRMGICHSCVGRLRSGRVRDLRTGLVHGGAGEVVRTCINAPEGAIEIEL